MLNRDYDLCYSCQIIHYHQVIPSLQNFTDDISVVPRDTEGDVKWSGGLGNNISSCFNKRCGRSGDGGDGGGGGSSSASGSSAARYWSGNWGRSCGLCWGAGGGANAHNGPIHESELEPYAKGGTGL